LEAILTLGLSMVDVVIMLHVIGLGRLLPAFKGVIGHRNRMENFMDQFGPQVCMVFTVNKLGLSMRLVIITNKLGLSRRLVIIADKLGLSRHLEILVNKLGLSSCLVILANKLGPVTCTVIYMNKIGLSMGMVYITDAIGHQQMALAWDYITTVLKIIATFLVMVWGEVDVEMDGRADLLRPGLKIQAPP
jgi:hypothetical protein